MSKKVLLAVFGASVLFLGLTIWIVSQLHITKPNSETFEQTRTKTGNQTEAVKNSEHLESDELQAADEIDTSDWKTYRNEEYGFEFNYPKDFGEVSINIKRGFDLNKEKISGRQIIGEFSEAADISFGSITADYTNSRAVFAMDFSGYRLENGTYFFMSSNGLAFPINPKKVIDDRILFLDCTSFEQNCEITGPSVALYRDQIGGLLNLDKEEFKGLIFLANKNKINESLFLKFLSTVRELQKRDEFGW